MPSLCHEYEYAINFGYICIIFVSCRFMSYLPFSARIPPFSILFIEAAAVPAQMPSSSTSWLDQVKAMRASYWCWTWDSCGVSWGCWNCRWLCLKHRKYLQISCLISCPGNAPGRPSSGFQHREPEDHGRRLSFGRRLAPKNNAVDGQVMRPPRTWWPRNPPLRGQAGRSLSRQARGQHWCENPPKFVGQAETCPNFLRIVKNPRIGHLYTYGSLFIYITLYNILIHPHIYIYIFIITYGPRKAVAEVSNHNEPIGRKSGIQLVRKIRKSMGFTFNCSVLNWLTD